jgi:Tol biopolymer transport system component
VVPGETPDLQSPKNDGTDFTTEKGGNLKRLSITAAGATALFVFLLSFSTVIQADQDAIRLTEEKEGFICPAFSPDGRYIAVTRENWSGIWTLSPQGAELKQLTADRGAGYRFTWSPDGRQIAYRAEKMVNSRRFFSIRIVDAETGHIEEMTDFQRYLGTPRWVLGDGTVVFETDRTGTLAQAQVLGLISSDDAGTSRDRVATTSRDLRIWVSDAYGDQKIPVSAAEERCFDPILSPDGAMVGYSVLSGGGSIVVARTDGSGSVNLGYGSNPSWSPDGRYLVFEVTTDDGHVITGSDLFIDAVDGTGRIRVTDTPEIFERWPSWSPDGTHIVYSAGGAIYLIPVPSSLHSQEEVAP